MDGSLLAPSMNSSSESFSLRIDKKKKNSIRFLLIKHIRKNNTCNFSCSFMYFSFYKISITRMPLYHTNSVRKATMASFYMAWQIIVKVLVKIGIKCIMVICRIHLTAIGLFDNLSFIFAFH